MSTYAVIPVNVLSKAKTRLCKLLTSEQRRELVVAMMSDVLSNAEKSPRISKMLVVSRDHEVFALCRKYGVEYIDEERAQGLNAALRKAVRHCLGARAESALIIPADIPLLRARDVDSVIKAGQKASVTIVPSDDGKGTNAMLLAPPNAISVAYGPDSFRKHVSRALKKGIKPRILRLRRVGLDIDRPGDLKRFRSRGKGTRTHRLLTRLKVPGNHDSKAKLSHSDGRS